MEVIDSIGVYWGPRRETIAECAARLHRYLQALGKEHLLLSTWYPKQRDRNAKKVPLSLHGSSADLMDILTAGVNRRDVGGDAIESLGFRVSLWNGVDGDQSFALSVKCGLFERNPNLGNAAVLTLPSEHAENEALQEQLLTRGIEAWEPDWGAVFFSGSAVVQERVGNGPFLSRAVWLKQESFFNETVAATRRPLLGGILVQKE